MLKYSSPILVSLLGAWALCLCTPLATYFQNVNEFSFNHHGLLISMSSFLIGTCIVLFVIQLIAEYIFPSENVNRFGRISAFQVIILGILVGLLCEGMIVSYRLPELAGIMGSFLSLKRTLLSALGWTGGIIVTLFFWRTLARHFIRIVLALFIMYTAVLGDAVLSRQEKVDVSIATVSVMDNLAFHEHDNVIVIVADSTPTYAVEEVLARCPDLRKKLDGFTLFSNNLGPGHQTVWAIPSLLQGQIFSGGGGV